MARSRIQVVDNIPLPPLPEKAAPKPRDLPRRIRYPWDDLKVGMSFYAEPKQSQDRVQLKKQIRSALAHWNKRVADGKMENAMRKIMTVDIRHEGEGVRVWRMD